MNRQRVSAGSIGFNLTTPAGRAVQHLLDRSALAADRLGDHSLSGWDLVIHEDQGRSLVVHPAYAAWCSDGQAALLLLIESLLGRTPVVLAWVLDALDDEQQRLVMEAVAIASGFAIEEVA